MAKKRARNNISKVTPSPAASNFATFIGGSRAKWLFFGMFLLVTLLLFQEFIFSDRMLFGSDTIPDGIYTRRYYKEYHEQFGGIPRWNPYILGGLPFIDAMHGDTFYPAAWLKFAMPLERALGFKLILHVLLAGPSMYALLRVLRLRREAAFLGGLMYMLAPSFVSWLYGGHDAKMYVIALVPLAFACLESGMRTLRIRWFVVLGALMGLLILTSHIQMAYYSYWALGLYFLFRLFFGGIGEERFERHTPVMLKQAGLFIGAIILALGLGAVQLLPSYAFTTTQSVRAGEERTGYDYATSWSMHPEEVAGMLVPSFQGLNAVDTRPLPQTYWGRNPMKINSEYHGIIPIIFALIALCTLRGKWRWFYLGIAVLALIYALGANTPLYRLFYALMPGVKNFRAPSMIIFLFGFSAVVLAASFISHLLDGNTSLDPKSRKLVWSIGALAGVGVIVSLMGQGVFTAWANFLIPGGAGAKAAAMSENTAPFIRDLWRVILIAAVALAGVWMLMVRKINGFAFVVLVALAAAFDGMVADSRFITTLDPARYPQLSAPDQTVQVLREQLTLSPQPFRILGMFSGKHGQNYYAMFGIPAADGMHNNELQTYERFRGGTQSANFLGGWVVDGNLVPEGLATNNYLRVAGIRYIVLDDGQGGTQLLPNEYALEGGFVAHDYRVAGSNEEAVEMLDDTSLDPSRTAVVTGTPHIAPSPGATGSSVTAYEPFNHGFALDVDLTAPGMVVLTENNVPGYWYADIDGEPAPIFTAYGTFMTVPCLAGKHRVTFTYRSAPYRTGKTLTLSSLGLIVLLITGTYATERLRVGKDTA